LRGRRSVRPGPLPLPLARRHLLRGPEEVSQFPNEQILLWHRRRSFSQVQISQTKMIAMISSALPHHLI
ncbi:hypothetical protein PMAYCL1PPCAC_26915, partial [Pristionchus mayeri]